MTKEGKSERRIRSETQSAIVTYGSLSPTARHRSVLLIDFRVMSWRRAKDATSSLLDTRPRRGAEAALPYFGGARSLPFHVQSNYAERIMRDRVRRAHTQIHTRTHALGN